MSEKPFTKYLLRLATDAGEVKRFRAGGEVAHISMEAAGLNREQQRALLDGDQERIDAYVAAELLHPGPQHDDGGTPVPVICLVQRGPH